jgi:hypothetical protein
MPTNLPSRRRSSGFSDVLATIIVGTIAFFGVALAAFFALTLIALGIVARVLFWAAAFWFIGWLFPDAFRAILDAASLPKAEPWMVGAAIGALSLIFRRFGGNPTPSK